MRTTSLLDALLPRTRQAVLGTLLLHPERSWFGRELARHLRLQPSTLERELTPLTRVGILSRRVEGRHVYYQANLDCPILVELRGLLMKTAGLVDVLSEALRPFERDIQFAFVYGSAARAEELTGSDVDLLVVGKVKPSSIAESLSRASVTLARDVNPTVFRIAEFTSKIEARQPFVTGLLRLPKLFVLGSESELEDLFRAAKS